MAAKSRASIPVRIGCSEVGSFNAIEVRGRIIPIADPDHADAAIASALPDKSEPVRLTNSVDTPWKCFGGAIYTLQRLGYRRIGFISEPPPAKASDN